MKNEKKEACIDSNEITNDLVFHQMNQPISMPVLGVLRIYYFAKNNITNIVGCNTCSRELVRVSKKVF